MEPSESSETEKKPNDAKRLPNVTRVETCSGMLCSCTGPTPGSILCSAIANQRSAREKGKGPKELQGPKRVRRQPRNEKT